MKRKKWLILTVILIILAIIIFWGSRPSKGKIIVKKTDQISTFIKVEQQYENDYLSFKYSDDYEKTIKENNLWLVGKSRIPESFTLICREFKNNFDEDSGVLIRRVKNNEYMESEMVVDGVTGQYFEKKDLSERTVFILKGEVMITLSMTANSNDIELGQKFEKIIESWEWK